MSKITLTIEADNGADLKTILASLNETQVVAISRAGVEVLTDVEAEAPVAQEKPKRASKKAAQEEAPPATPASPPAESSTGETTESPSEPDAPAPEPALATAGDVTLDMLKEEMTNLLKRSTAATAQATLREATGETSLSKLDPASYPAAYAALKAA